MTGRQRRASWQCASILALLAVVVIAGGCRETTRRSRLTVPGQYALTTVYAGSSLRFPITIVDRRLLKAERVEIVLENAVEYSISEGMIGSAKLEVKPTVAGDRMVIEVPTSGEFRPGIWHVKKLRFDLGAAEGWREYVEGEDFAGFPFNLANPGERPGVGKVLLLEEIEMIPQ